jgi:hypothetical protein
MTHIDDTRPTSSHFPEPWTYDFNRPFGIVNIIAPDPSGEYPKGLYVAEIDTDDVGCFTSYEQHEANTRRICAAVNACEGISTESLEKGVILEMLEALRLLTRAVEERNDAAMTMHADYATVLLDKATGRAA